MTILHSAPKAAPNDGVLDTLAASLGHMVLGTTEECGEIIITVQRDRVEDALRLLRDGHEYQQLMEIAGVDYPSRPERFDVVYMLLSLTRNHRIMVKVAAAENTPVPTVTTLWPVAGWLEREIFDMYGVVFAGNPDLRRILTDYGFEGHPFRKDFPLTGYTELRYSEEDQRVVYEPVKLAQDLRVFDFMSPWEGADYPLPGDEKAKVPIPARASVAAPPSAPHTEVREAKTTDKPADSGAGKAADQAAKPGPATSATSGGTVAGQGQGEPVPQKTPIAAPGAPDPTEDRPDRAPRDKGDSALGGQGPAPEGS